MLSGGFRAVPEEAKRGRAVPVGRLRYWDVERGTELMLQDGHPSECTSIAPHPDGSLLLSADSSGYVFLWDLRSGKRILVLEGHADKVTSSCFHPNGYDAATASLDNMIRMRIKDKRDDFLDVLKFSYNLAS